jgi:hypothetical protein
MKSEEDGDLSILYSASVSEIISFKAQQWHTTNYALLLFAVLVAIAKTTSNLLCLEIVILYMVALTIFGVGVYVIHTLFASLDVRRRRLVHIREKMPEGFREAWRYGESVEKIPDNPDDKIKLSWLFYSVLCLGLIITLWLLTKLT